MSFKLAVFPNLPQLIKESQLFDAHLKSKWMVVNINIQTPILRILRQIKAFYDTFIYNELIRYEALPFCRMVKYELQLITCSHKRLRMSLSR